MREPAWMVKYQAREALKNGRPEDAHRLLDGLVASGRPQGLGPASATSSAGTSIAPSGPFATTTSKPPGKT